jgi:hypothetical protein
MTKGKLELILVPGDLRVGKVGIVVCFSAKVEMMCADGITSICLAPTVTILAACSLQIPSRRLIKLIVVSMTMK